MPPSGLLKALGMMSIDKAKGGTNQQSTSTPTKKGSQKTNSTKLTWSDCWHRLPVELLGEVLCHLATVEGPAGRYGTEVSRATRPSAWVARYTGRSLQIWGLKLLDHPNSVLRGANLHFKSLELGMMPKDGFTEKDTLPLLGTMKIVVDELSLKSMMYYDKVPYSSLPKHILRSIVSIMWLSHPLIGPEHLVEDTTFPNVRHLHIQGLGSYVKFNSKRTFSFPALEALNVTIIPLMPGQFHPDDEQDKSGPMCFEEFFKLVKIPKRVPVNVYLQINEAHRIDEATLGKLKTQMGLANFSRCFINRHLTLYEHHIDLSGQQWYQMIYGFQHMTLNGD